jgi:NADH dehydrogenase
MSGTAMPHVVIIGGGFAGVAAARALKREKVRITLIDRRNHHLFQPLLYQVATAALSPSDIAEPIRSMLRQQDNATVRMATVEEVDAPGKRIRIAADATHASWLAFDKLVIAAGVSHSYFGNDGWEEHAPGLKTIGDALSIRRRVLSAFEAAEWCEPGAERDALMTFVVVGGGPTGVELAGALSEIACGTLLKDFRNIDTSQARVVLLEGAQAVLTPYSPKLQASAKLQLEQLGVEVRLGARVTDVDALGVTLGEQRLEARTVLWAAGVQGAPLATSLDVPLDRAGRVIVGTDCSVPSHPEIFVVGDLAHFVQDETTLSGVAPVALQQGRFVGQAIAHDLHTRPRGAFRYGDKGSMATIGRSKAVASTFGIELSGMLAWLAWAFIHLLFLVTFRNKLVVFTKWTWAWFTYERASRLLWQNETARDRPGRHENTRIDASGVGR